MVTRRIKGKNTFQILSLKKVTRILVKVSNFKLYLSESDIIVYDSQTKSALCVVCKLMIDVKLEGEDVVLSNCK